jgi:hypothetical protein
MKQPSDLPMCKCGNPACDTPAIEAMMAKGLGGGIGAVLSSILGGGMPQPVGVVIDGVMLPIPRGNPNLN